MKQLRDALGTQNVFDNNFATLHYGHSTLNKKVAFILGAVQPRTIQEVAEIVALASKHAVPLYPISLGNNWGYGSKTPTTEKCLVVDLSRMNSILEFDETQGTITVEPGVTTLDVERFLEDRNACFIAPTTGAGPLASMIGNALEKGTSSASFFERFSSLLHLEAVLPDASVYSSYISELSNSPTVPYKWATGPYLDGLFAQSGFGIVTKATFLLAPKPTYAKVLFVKGDKQEQIDTLIGVMQKSLLSLGGTLSSFKVDGPIRSIASFTRYKAVQEKSNALLSEETIKERLQLLSFGYWNCFGILQGEKAVVKIAQKILTKTLRAQGFKAVFYDEKSLSSRRKFFGTFSRKIRERFAYLASAWVFLDRNLGRNLRFNGWFPVWRHAHPSIEPKDLALVNLDDQANCGFIFFVSVLPVGISFSSFIGQAEALCSSYFVEPLYSFTSSQSRYIHFALQITFDKTSPEHASKAERCYEDLFRLAVSFGGLPYRVPNNMFHLLPEIMPNHWQLVKKIKEGLDPNNLMSPGRYVPTKK